MRRLSIVTVILNAEKTLPRLTAALELEDQDAFEWICIDGLSSDASLSIAKSARIKNKIITSEIDVGIYDAMNKGAKLCNGEWIWFINSDDIPAQNSVKAINKILEYSPTDLALVSFGCLIFNGLKFEKVHFGSSWKLRIQNSIPHPSTLFRKDLFEAYDYNKKYRICGDYDLFVRLIILGKCKIKFFNEVIVTHYRGGASSNSNVSHLESDEIRRTLFLKHTYLIVNILKRTYIFLKQIQF